MKHYSRRELYALGEPLGESVTQAKVGGGRIYGGGGSGGGGQQAAPAPQQNTTYSTNVPEYARPYVETMLGAAQKQAYQYDPSGNIVGFQPYVPYGATVSGYTPTGAPIISNTAQQQAESAIAGFSPMQEQAFRQTAMMQVPGQYGLGSAYAGAGGTGAANLAQQASMAGREYNLMATNPYTMGAFMSPYMQDAVDRQKFEAIRDYQKTMPTLGAQATGAGAFGGSRQAIVASEAQRNVNQQLQNIQAAGTQKAYEQAQQAMQYGAGLGLQGYGTALQGTGQLTGAGKTLADIGGAQLAAQQGIVGLQSQAGAQQQALEQQRINQAIQNYALMQQYPQMQLSMMSSLLRGLPLQQATTQTYQAAPSALSQIGGLGMAGVGLYGMGRSAGMFKEGGEVKKLASGGITGLSKKVLLNPEDFSTKQIDDMTKKGMISKLVGVPVLDAKMKDEQRMKLAQAAQQPRPIDTIARDIMARAEAAQGIDTAPSNLPTMSAFDGGIVAMADGGEVPHYDGRGPSQVIGTMYGFDDTVNSDDTTSPNIEEYVIDPLTGQKIFSGYGPKKSATTIPAAPAALKKDTGIKILPDAKPPVAAGTPPPPAMPQVDLSGKGITSAIDELKKSLTEGERDPKEQKKEAFWTALAQWGLGAMGGTSPYGLTNIGQAGVPAVTSGAAALRDIDAQRQKRAIALAQMGLEGEKVKADYAKLGIMKPYYDAYAGYLSRRPGTTSTAGLGNVTPAVADKVMTRFQGYEADPKSAPFFGQLPKDVQKGLTDYKPGTESYNRSIQIFRQYNDRALQQYLNSLRGLSAKTSVSASSDED